MKTPRILVLALALFGACAAPAMAAPMTYDVSIPLIADGAGNAVATSLLTGSLVFDADDWSAGRGSFTIASLGGDALMSDSFSGLSILMDAGDGSLGVYFDGMQADGYELYFNIDTATTADTLNFSNVSYSQTSGTTFYTSLGGTVLPAVAVGDVSPVPLPPALSLFGGALLMVGGLGALRLRPRQAWAAARR